MGDIVPDAQLHPDLPCVSGKEKDVQYFGGNGIYQGQLFIFSFIHTLSFDLCGGKGNMKSGETVNQGKTVLRNHHKHNGSYNTS